MAIVYLEPGQKLRFTAVARVGETGTIIDLKIDFSGTAEYVGNDPSKGVDAGFAFGVITDQDRYTYDVFFEDSSGRLWFDDECGY